MTRPLYYFIIRIAEYNQRQTGSNENSFGTLIGSWKCVRFPDFSESNLGDNKNNTRRRIAGISGEIFNDNRVLCSYIYRRRETIAVESKTLYSQ